MQTERLLALANWLEGGAKHSLKIGNRKVVFDMAVGIQVLADMGETFEPNACGTACCVAGAAVQFFAPDAADKMVGDVGEQLRNKARFSEERGVPPDPDDWRMEQQVGWSYVFEAASIVLGLNERQARMLFQPSMSYKEDGYVYDPPGHMELRDFTDPLWAARTIRTGVKTGEFNWLENQ